MITRQLYRWAPASLWIFMSVVMIAFSGCATTIEDYEWQKAEYDRINNNNNELIQQYSREIYELKAWLIAYENMLKNEVQLNNENTKLRQRIASVETELKERHFKFMELGENITPQVYGLILKDMDDFNNLENFYNRQLIALSSYQNGSSEYTITAENIRALALLDIISEAILTVNIPRDALHVSAMADDPKFEQALTALANAQDQMIIALNDFKLRDGDQSNTKYFIAQSSCKNMLASISDFVASPEGKSPLAKDLIRQLKTMRTVTKITSILLTANNDSSTPIAKRRLVVQSLKDYQPIAKQLSYLIPTSDINNIGLGQSTNSAIRFLNRMEWIMAMSTYCEGSNFKPETYIQMRLGEIRPLKVSALEIIKSYELVHARP